MIPRTPQQPTQNCLLCWPNCIQNEILRISYSSQYLVFPIHLSLPMQQLGLYVMQSLGHHKLRKAFKTATCNMLNSQPPLPPPTVGHSRGHLTPIKNLLHNLHNKFSIMLVIFYGHCSVLIIMSICLCVCVSVYLPVCFVTILRRHMTQLDNC